MGKSKDLATGETRFVNTAGDTMTGDLTISSTAGQLKLTDTDGTEQNTTIKQSGGNLFIQARDNTNNAGIVFAGNGGGNYTEHMRIDGSGRVTTPNQPSFTAHRQTDQDITQAGANVNLIFDSVDHNIGNHYSTSTGKFTCPVSGVYFISFSIRLDYLGGGYTWIYPFVNGNPRYDTGGPNFITQDTGSYTTLAAAGQLNLSANDYVQIYAYVSSDSDWDFENASNFSMRLMG